MPNRPTCGECDRPGSLRVGYHKSIDYGGCNGCTDHPTDIWTIELRGLQVRLCDACFDDLVAQRAWRQKTKETP